MRRGGYPYLSVVVPVFNEQESVRPLYLRIKTVCDGLALSYEMIFVDDGSTDKTFEILQQLHSSDGRMKVVRFRKNYGQTPAMAAGFRAASGKIILSMDGDLQNDPADIPRLLKTIEEGYDVVCGWRKDRKDKLISRRIPSIIANWLIGKITGVPIHDNGCSLKAYRGALIKKVPLYSEMHRFIPAMATLADARIAEMEVAHHARQYGKSKYGISRVWKVLSDLLLIKMVTGFAATPGRWFALISMPINALGCVLLVAGVFAGSSVVTLATTGLLLLVLGGHLIITGILGEVIVRTGDFQPHKAIGRGEPRSS